jgi:adenylate cyclase
MSFRLVSADGAHTFEMRPGLSAVLGRALSCDLPVLDPTISRRHAELIVENGGIRVRDLGSSNGTFVGGQRAEQARLKAGDRIVFGRVAFEVRESAVHLVDDASAEKRLRAARAGTTIIRQVPVPDADQSLREALDTGDEGLRVDDAAPLTAHHRRDRLKLALLVEMSKALTRTATIDELLDKMVLFTFKLLDVERIAVLLGDDPAKLVTSISRNRGGLDEPTELSPALVATVMEQKVAVLSDSHDAHRPTPSSVAAMGPGSAACAPLIAGQGRLLGVLYVESATPSVRVSDEDLDFLVAFAGIVAVALDNIRYGERVRREARVRENFERFFTPQIAERIASMPQSVVLGGERRNVAVLFADIRGFTPLAAKLAPDDTARLLNEFFSAMVECVFRHGGTLDKFLGDAVMAQWGAPLSAPDDADRALNAARDMLAAVDELSARELASGRPGVQIGIGLNYGDAFAGFTGSERRLEYTVIGDTVNTASRLCAWAEGREILMSVSMRGAVSNTAGIVERAPLILRGKPDPVPVFRTALV